MREIPPEPPGLRVDVLGQKAIAVAATEGIDEEIARVITTAKPPPGIDQPETADEKGRFWESEVVSAGVAHHVMSARKLLADYPDRAHVARIVWLDQAELGEQQHACIEVVIAERRRERAALVAPGFFKQSALNTVRDFGPMSGSIGETKV